MESDGGLTCLSWNKSRFDPVMVVVGTSAGTVRILSYDDTFRRWIPIWEVRDHEGDVHSVSWAPSLGRCELAPMLLLLLLLSCVCVCVSEFRIGMFCSCVFICDGVRSCSWVLHVVSMQQVHVVSTPPPPPPPRPFSGLGR